MAVPQFLPEKPGKMIAVHVAFESRAAQRGRWPKTPSYFLKATSTLAESGGVVERPAGTELLAFEGEIALIIGKAARNVSLAEAWDYVAYVTASNDLGIYDYRAQDKGSNTRSKSRDGYTPIGPKLIDAQTIDPKGLRLRTWVNGEVVQEGTSSDADLIFPLAQFVADLSQHMTLEPGDIILTGTPAGSTVIEPGDVVEVEVDVPGGVTSGRLKSTVVEIPTNFDPALGNLPKVDDKQREDAYGDRESAGLPPLPSSELSAELKEKLEEAPTAGLSAQLRGRGINQCVIEGVYPQTKGTKMVGVARTLRFVAGREDLFKSHGGGLNEQKKVFDTVKEGEVIVIEARQEPGSGTLGDILALRAKTRGAAGVVTDGGVRDYEAVREIGLPVFTQGAHPCVLGRKHVPWDSDIAVSCGNATVVPGDIIVGDDDGVIVIPRDLAEEVADAALAKEHEDEWVAEQVKAGASLDGMFPPTGANKEAYLEFKNGGGQ
ncbi:TPA: fumarylacetoacetate hydrolase family protein [Corynebacterium striatum]|nr:fumarylacetoacetate hydrolase family protein [Corynebacterium striatum]HAT1167841.1 fumarylacetoacetate hydrolase family protein [Corynebacterium striatum]HAT1174240.1 fumarylacetoacetate hydrolase family protein [Corynebacterium striatum]HAT1199463.1 fumarylacetoacetate hydrolase family protein [Corynebacterium striatum]HAT1201103.1 fumarylacetoacetate hydrolase family protein [Corynebacterium striatum]